MRSNKETDIPEIMDRSEDITFSAPPETSGLPHVHEPDTHRERADSVDSSGGGIPETSAPYIECAKFTDAVSIVGYAANNNIAQDWGMWDLARGACDIHNSPIHSRVPEIVPGARSVRIEQRMPSCVIGSLTTTPPIGNGREEPNVEEKAASPTIFSTCSPGS